MKRSRQCTDLLTGIIVSQVALVPSLPVALSYVTSVINSLFSLSGNRKIHLTISIYNGLDQLI